MPIEAFNNIESEEDLEILVKELEDASADKSQTSASNDPKTAESYEIEAASEQAANEQVPPTSQQVPSTSNCEESSSNRERPSIDNERECCVCLKHAEGAHTCKTCLRNMHPWCGYQTEEEEGYGSTLVCDNCSEKNKTEITAARKRAHDGLQSQAKRMLTRSRKLSSSVCVGDNVLLKKASVDKSNLDFHNIIGIIVRITAEFCYEIATEDGIIDTLYTRNQFTQCENNEFLLIENVPKVQISVRSAAMKSTLGNGQGFFACNCKTKCTSKTCKCRKNSVKCNSKCHNSSPCSNK